MVAVKVVDDRHKGGQDGREEPREMG